jgi:hypothetical protein
MFPYHTFSLSHCKTWWSLVVFSLPFSFGQPFQTRFIERRVFEIKRRFLACIRLAVVSPGPDHPVIWVDAQSIPETDGNDSKKQPEHRSGGRNCVLISDDSPMERVADQQGTEKQTEGAYEHQRALRNHNEYTILG